MSGPPTGRHLGKKLADIIGEVHVKARAATLPGETDHRARYHKSFMEQVESDLAPTLKTMFQHVVDDPELPEETKAFFRPMVAPQHQGQFFLTVAAILGFALAGPGAAAAGLLEQLRNHSFAQWPNTVLTPAEAALAVVRGVISASDGEDEARFAGLNGERFAKLLDITGEPIALEQALLLYRRGQMDEGTLERLIRQSRIRNEWIPFAKELRFVPPGAGQVIAAAVEGHLSPDEARRRLAETGINPDNFQWLYDTAGRPPGAQEMIALWRRGKVTEAQVREAVRESDIKNKYIDAIVETKRHVPPPRSVVAMLRHGSIDDGLAREMLAVGGVEGRDADVMIKDGHHQATTTMRQLAAGEIITAYTDGILDRAGAKQHLVDIRYNDEAANVMLAVADLRRERRYLESAIGRIRSTYTGHHIPRNDASVALDQLGLPADSRDHLIHLWDLERAANVKMLTEAQVAKALKEHVIDGDEFKRRLLALGYLPADVDILFQLQNPAPTTGVL